MGAQKKAWKGRLFFGLLFSYFVMMLIPIIVGTVAYKETVKISFSVR